MSTEERTFEDRLRSSLNAWADTAPPPRTTWEPTLREPWWSDGRLRLTRLGPVLAITVVIAVLAVIATREESAHLEVVSRPNVVTADIPVGERDGVRVLRAADDAVFVASENDRRLYRIDARTNEVTGGVALAVPDGVAVSDDGVFAVLEGPRLARLDPTTLEVAAEIPAPADVTEVTFFGGKVWLVANRTFTGHDPETLTQIAAPTWDVGPGFVSEGDSGVWRTDLDSGQVLELDPDTGEISRELHIPGEPRAIADAGGVLWVTDVANDRVSRIDPDDGSIDATIGVGRFPHSISAGAGAVWVTNFHDGTLSQIDPDTNEVTATVPIGFRPGGTLVFDGSVWVAVHRQAKVVRLDPQAVMSESLAPVDLAEHLVDIGGRQLFLRCMGTGAPTVVLEANVFAWSEEWLFVQYGLQRSNRVCAYDRAGLGRSDPRSDPATAERIVADLETALRGAGIDGPYVMVGHGYGGLSTRLLASSDRDQVVGLVLVDAITPTFIDEVLPLLPPEQANGLEESFRTESELAGARESFEQAARVDSLGALPLVVITRDSAAGPLPPDAEALWQSHQQQLTQLSTRARLVIARGTGASIPLDAPELVVQAVRDVIEAAR